MPDNDAVKWNAIYRKTGNTPPLPARVLRDYGYLLPGSGKALDLACGRGGNALFLAGLGLETHAWDVSCEALSQLKDYTDKMKLHVMTRLCDLTIERPESSSFDVIAVSRYLDRTLAPFLLSALNKDGLLFYQTFTSEKTADIGPTNSEFLLKPNELLRMFSELHILLYREDGLTGDTEQGLRNEAMLIGLKR